MPAYGKAGQSLTEGQFAANDQVRHIGAAAERQTEKLLNQLAAKRGFDVIHDLKIPSKDANIDHIVISGRNIWLIDTKRWRNGTWWTGWHGHVHVGLHRYTATNKAGQTVYPAEKLTLGMALRILGPLLPTAQFHKPLVAIWPATTRIGLLRLPDAKPIHAIDLPKHLPRKGRPADPQILACLKGLL